MSVNIKFFHSTFSKQNTKYFQFLYHTVFAKVELCSERLSFYNYFKWMTRRRNRKFSKVKHQKLFFKCSFLVNIEVFCIEENCVKKDAAKDASQAAVGSSSQAISHCDAVEQSSSAIETIADPAQPDDLVDYETYRVLKKTRKLMKVFNR